MWKQAYLCGGKAMTRNPNWTEDEIVLVIDLLSRTDAHVPDASGPEIVGLSEMLRSLPIHIAMARKRDFRSPNSVRLKCFHLLANEPGLYAGTNLVATNADVWHRYWKKPDVTLSRVASIQAAAVVIAAAEADSEEEEAVQEGGLVLRAHMMRERGRRLRRKLIDKCLRQHGQVVCEGCRHSEHSYSESEPLVRRVFEAHHMRPLGNGGPVETKLTDLVLLCANCHRLIHALMCREHRVVEIVELQRFIRNE